jgi:hypothetical protein
MIKPAVQQLVQTYLSLTPKNEPPPRPAPNPPSPGIAIPGSTRPQQPQSRRKRTNASI